MVELVLVYCMIAKTDVYRENRPVLEDQLTPMSCLLAGQTTATQWLEEHSEWRLASWRCEIGRPREARL